MRRAALQDIIPKAELTERQTEALLLRFGLEGLFNPDIESTGDEKRETAIGRIFGAADMIHKNIVTNQGRAEKSGYWADAESQGRTDEFQEIWDKAFRNEGEGEGDEARGSLIHKPFDPNIPASLQISVLYQLTADREPTAKELAKRAKSGKESSVWPPRYNEKTVPQENLGRLHGLMLDLYNAFGPGDDISDVAGAGRPAWAGGGPPIGVWRANSKQSVQIKLAAAKNRIDQLKEAGLIPPEFAPEKIIPSATGRIDYGSQYQDPRDARKKPGQMEAVDIVLDYLFKLMLESIECGEITEIEDIDRYDQTIITA
jgi:hypothetical protein